MKVQEYLFSDEQRQKIEKYLLKKRTGRSYKNLRATVNGIYWIMKTGSTWRTLPPCFGKWQEVYQCFSRQPKEGIFEKFFSEVNKESDTSEISIDSTFVKVHQDALSGSKKGYVQAFPKAAKLPKFMSPQDNSGRPVRINLSAGNVNDYLLFEKQISGINLENILADRAYSNYEIIRNLKLKGATICIPPKFGMKNTWTYDKNLYKARNKVERFFCSLKHNRRIATRYDKLNHIFLSFIYFHSILLWLKQFVNTL